MASSRRKRRQHWRAVSPQTKGLRYGGLMTYPKPGVRPRGGGLYRLKRRDLIAKAGLETPIISTGGAPEMWSDEGLEAITEYRTGTYVFFDRSLVDARRLRSRRIAD